ncbi:MAG: hypothetical protein Q9161_007687 [Pseudevernia consocians]
MKHLTLDPNRALPATRDLPAGATVPDSLPRAKETKGHPSGAGGENARLLFVGTATVVLYHVEASLRRDLPIITTPHAKSHLASASKDPAEAFTAVHDLDFFDECLVDIAGSDNRAAIKVTGMPGKHVPPGPGGVAGKMNDLLGAVPPTNGWMLQLGHLSPSPSHAFRPSFSIYVSGDTLLVPELREIPTRYPRVDLMLVHLGGTTIPSPSLPLLMVTMDAAQGVELVRLVGPEVVIPVHFDDYDVFLSPLSDFKKAMEEAGLGDKVVYLDRKDAYRFKVEE